MKVIAIRKEPFEVQTLNDVTQISVGSATPTMITVNYGRDQTQTFNPDYYILQILL